MMMTLDAGKPGLSEDAKNAVADTLECILQEFAVSTEATAAFYPYISSARDMSVYFKEYSDGADGVVRNLFMTELLSLCGDGSYELVVDAGSGPGLSSERILESLKPRRIILVDMFPEALELARQRLAAYDYAEYRVGDVRHLTDALGHDVQAGLVFMRSLMKYIHVSDYGRVFEGAYQALKPGGVLIFDFPLAFQAGGSWLSPEHFPFRHLAEVMRELYDIPRLAQLSPELGTPASIVETVNQALALAAFSTVEPIRPSFKISFGQAASFAVDGLNVFFNSLRDYSPGAYHEVRQFDAQISQALGRKLEAFEDKEIHLGQIVFKAVK